MNVLSRSPRIVGAIAAGLIAATALTAAVSIPSTPVNAQTVTAIDPSRGYADLVDRVMPAVISVKVQFANASAEQDNDAETTPGLPQGTPFDDFFKQFRQGRPGLPQRQPSMGQGSGFIISADGYAVTNNHVVQNASVVTVSLRDGVELQADVIGTDPKTDLALIKIKSDKPMAFVEWAEKEPRVGDLVMAVGNPFGLGGTVTTGIVSARGRDIGAGPYDDFLQIDAAINHGNSGGPAFNLDGDVVGINTAIFSPSGGSVGIGFAVPASTAVSVIDSLKETGAVTRGWLGVQIQPVTADIAESLGLADAKGAIIAAVTEESPAFAAGLQQGDTILKLDGHDVTDSRDLARKVAKIAPGKSVPVSIVRDGKAMDIAVKIGAMPDEQRVAGGADTPSKSALANLGIKIAPAEDGAGVAVVDVEAGSAAAERGLRAGDIILEVAGTEVHSPADLREALQSGKAKKRVLLLVRSGDNQRFIAIPANQG